MDTARYESTRAGGLQRVGQGEQAYVAFLPNEIPREVNLSPPTVVALSRADQAVGRLDAFGERLPNPHLVARPYLRREAVASTRIEGTQSTLGEVLAAEAEERPERSTDVQEVLNYVAALERGIALLDELPLSNRLLREMHAVLLAGVRGANRTPGEFRRSQNWIGGHGPSDAIFVPPPPHHLPDLLTDLERFLHEQAPLPELVSCALVHYQFETIHPFLDGNGRLGRLLIVFHLIARHVLRQPLLYLSAYFEANRDMYVEGLQGVRERGDYDAWIRFFVTAVAAQAESALDVAERLLDLQATYRDRLRQSGQRGRVVEVAESLVGTPYVTAPRVADATGITRQGAQYVLRSLEELGILRRVESRGRATLYVAQEVLDRLDPAARA